MLLWHRSNLIPHGGAFLRLVALLFVALVVWMLMAARGGPELESGHGDRSANGVTAAIRDIGATCSIAGTGLRVGLITDTAGTQFSALGGISHWYHLFQELVPQKDFLSSGRQLPLLILLQSARDAAALTRMGALFLAGAFSRVSISEDIYVGIGDALGGGGYRVSLRYRLNRLSSAGREMVPLRRPDSAASIAVVDIPGSCIRDVARVGWDKACRNKFRAPLGCPYSYFNEARGLVGQVCSLCGLQIPSFTPTAVGDNYSLSIKTRLPLIDPFTRPDIRFIHYYFRYSEASERAMLRRNVEMILRGGQSNVSLYSSNRRSSSKSGHALKIILYQRDRDRRFVELEATMDRLHSKLRSALGTGGYDLQLHMHNEHYPPCALLRRLGQTDVLISSHGFQNILINFQRDHSIVLEIEPFNYVRYEIFAAFSAGYNYKYGASRTFLYTESPAVGLPMRIWEWARSRGYAPGPRECLKVAACRVWSRRNDIRLSDAAMDELIRVFTGKSQ